MRARAFTLLELLVVVAIIATLAGILLFASRTITARARAAHCVGNLRQLGAALNLYLAENNMTMPTMVAARASAESDEPAIDNTLDAFLDDTEVFRCRADVEEIWRETGTSYFWNNLLNGQKAGDLKLLGQESSEVGIPVIADKEAFHQRIGDEVNILYADGHVDKEVRFLVQGP